MRTLVKVCSTFIHFYWVSHGDPQASEIPTERFRAERVLPTILLSVARIHTGPLAKSSYIISSFVALARYKVLPCREL